LGRKTISREIPERRRFMKGSPPEEVIRAVAKAFGVKEGEVQSKRSRWNTARKGAMYLSQRYSGVGNVEVGKIFGGIH
jgi:chromosomal replication initiation ATPase DnaA